LIAASSVAHGHHPQALAALRSLRNGENHGWMSQHSVAETYAILTSAPLTPRIQPGEALKILESSILTLIGVVALTPQDYRDTIRDMAAGEWRSGRIYDALHLRCAEKQPIDRIYTFNVREFQQLAPHLRDKICAP
jgi:predicted nucleic acid-binding protein